MQENTELMSIGILIEFRVKDNFYYKKYNHTWTRDYGKKGSISYEVNSTEDFNKRRYALSRSNPDHNKLSIQKQLKVKIPVIVL